jgi:hypothetical protein
MARPEEPPFPRGDTFYNGGAIDANNLGGLQWEGKEWVFEDINILSGVGAKQSRSGQYVTCRIVRNVSGVNILPKQLCVFQTAFTAGAYGGRVDGLASVGAGADWCFPADEYLPAAGVPNNDLFWLVVKGPALCLTDLAGGANNSIAVGAPLVSLTGTSSQATTAGRVMPQTLAISTTGATLPLANMIQNRIGRAMSAMTTAQTNAGVLVDVGKW